MQPRQIYWHAQGMHEVPDDGRWIDERLAERLARLPYTKRREEARMARWTAKLTIAMALDLPQEPAALGSVLIINAPDGAPEASVHGRSLDAVIAMTDRADWAVSAIMSGGPRIGCDLELVEPRSPEFVSDYLTNSEQRRIGSLADTPLYANLIWSAKESALKVLRTGLRRDTRSVEVSFEEGPAGRWCPLTVRSAEGAEFPGWWLRSGAFVLTVAAEIATPPPTSLVDPQPLSLAEPSHRWLENPYS